MRKEYGVGEGREVSLHVTGGDGGHLLEGRGRMLLRLARIGSVETTAPPEGAAGASAVLRDGTELFLPLAGIIDLDREREPAAREIGRLSGLLQGIEAKLANRNFVTRAPGAVVEREREKRKSCKLQLTKWNEKLTSLRGGDR